MTPENKKILKLVYGLVGDKHINNPKFNSSQKNLVSEDSVLDFLNDDPQLDFEDHAGPGYSRTVKRMKRP